MLAGNLTVEHWSTYVGRAAPRFILSFDVQPADVSFGQTIIVAKGLDARDKLKQEVEVYLQKTFPGTDAYVKLLEIGSPVGKPIQYRVSGENLQTVRDLARKLGSIVGTDPSLKNLAFDRNEPARVVKIDVLQDKARQLGVSSQDIAMALNTVVQGNAVTQVRDNIYLVDVIGRAAEKERGSIDTLLDLQLQSSSGQSVPLSSVATFHYELEQPTIWRRDRVPTITIKAGIGDATQPATVVKALSDKVAAFEKTCRLGIPLQSAARSRKAPSPRAPLQTRHRPCSSSSQRRALRTRSE
ncbi:AcrB/AcrD/AcrF family protein [Rhizobium azibense]|nr:AcrB/AcrD/AcrF family protein [Rhizobium azibense]